MSNGKGCQCNAHCEHECCCDADWTPKEVYDLRAELARRTAEVAKANAERDEANARLAVSMEAHQITISGTVASLLHMITLTREAAGCRDGDNLRAFVSNMRTMIEAGYAMGYEWRWTKSIDADGEQVGAWVMRDAPHANTTDVPMQDGGAA
jgi:hypothetical protein